MTYCNFCYTVVDLDKMPDEGVCSKCGGTLVDAGDPPKTENFITKNIKEMIKKMSKKR